MRAWGMLFAATLMLALSGTVTAKIYKWVDDDGQIHYGQEAPHGVDATPMSVHTAPPSRSSGPSPDHGGAGQAKPATDNKPSKADQSNDGSKQADVLAENCKIARQNLDVLQRAGPNGRYRQDNGDVIRYKDGGWQARVDENKQFLDEHCQKQ